MTELPSVAEQPKPKRTRKKKTPTFPQAEVVEVVLKIPVATPPEPAAGTNPGYVDVAAVRNLTPEQRSAYRSFIAGVNATELKLENGTDVHGGHYAVKWLLEQIASQLKS